MRIGPALGQGQSREAGDDLQRRPARRAFHPAHLHQQGKRFRGIRDRRRRLRLQLSTATEVSAAMTDANDRLPPAADPPDTLRTRPSGVERSGASSLLSAALALPGLAATLVTTLATSLIAHSARAEEPPDHGTIDFKYLYYHDYQQGEGRMRVSAPSVHVLLP